MKFHSSTVFVDIWIALATDFIGRAKNDAFRTKGKPVLIRQL